MSASIASSILRLRLLVGFLGEKSQFAWWATSFWGGPSSTFLDPLFPKTSNLARYHGVVEAARLAHDERLNTGCYHLFRLPEEIEQDIHAQILASGSDLPLIVSSKDAAIAQLAEITNADSSVAQGPRSVGSIAELSEPATLQNIAGLYLRGFQSGTHVYPYLVG